MAVDGGHLGNMQIRNPLDIFLPLVTSFKKGRCMATYFSCQTIVDISHISGIRDRDGNYLDDQ